MRSPSRLLTMVAALALTTSCAWAGDVSLMVGGIEKQIYLPVVLAKQLGYFQEQGLDVELLSEPAGVEAADEMLAGAVQGVVGFYDHTIELQSLGKYTESVVQLGQAPGEVEVISSKHPEIVSVGDFKGHSIGVTGLGSSTDFLTEYLLVRSGLTLGDVTPVPVGAGDSLISAMHHDQIQAAMTTEPTVSRLLESGAARILIDTRSLAGSKATFGGTYPAACIYMENAWVESHRDVVQKLVNAMVETMRYISTHSAEDIAAHMPSDFFVGDRKLYVRSLANGLQMFTTNGRMPSGGPATVLSVLSQIRSSLRTRGVDLSKTYTNEFVDRAIAGG